MEEELRQNLNAAMEQAVSDIGQQGKPRSKETDITSLQQGKMQSLVLTSYFPFKPK